MPAQTKLDPNTPGGRIRMLRLANGLTQAALAAKVYVSQPAIAQWETNRWLPAIPTQFRIADALGSTRSSIFGAQ